MKELRKCRECIRGGKLCPKHQAEKDIFDEWLKNEEEKIRIEENRKKIGGDK